MSEKNNFLDIQFEIRGLIPTIHAIVQDRTNELNDEIDKQMSAFFENNGQAVAEIIAKQIRAELRAEIESYVKDRVQCLTYSDLFEESIDLALIHFTGFESKEINRILRPVVKELYDEIMSDSPLHYRERPNKPIVQHWRKWDEENDD